MDKRSDQMLSQEIFSALAFAFLIGLGCLSNFLTHRIDVQVLSEENEVINYKLCKPSIGNFP